MLAPCSCSRAMGHQLGRRVPQLAPPTLGSRRPASQKRALGDGEGSPTPSTAVDADEEARIEALEARLSKSKSKSARRQIPIRNMTPRQEDNSSSNLADWKEGKLFPEGWEEMPVDQKVVELYMGKRGALFWANKLAWGGAWVLGGAWILFRVVGPALGLYKLQGDLTLPPI